MIRRSSLAERTPEIRCGLWGRDVLALATSVAQFCRQLVAGEGRPLWHGAAALGLHRSSLHKWQTVGEHAEALPPPGPGARYSLEEAYQRVQRTRTPPGEAVDGEGPTPRRAPTPLAQVLRRLGTLGVTDLRRLARRLLALGTPLPPLALTAPRRPRPPRRGRAAAAGRWVADPLGAAAEILQSFPPALAALGREIRALLAGADKPQAARAIAVGCEALREEGESVGRIAAAVGVDRTTLWKWRYVGLHGAELLARYPLEQALRILRGRPRRSASRRAFARVLAHLPTLSPAEREALLGRVLERLAAAGASLWKPAAPALTARPPARGRPVWTALAWGPAPGAGAALAPRGHLEVPATSLQTAARLRPEAGCARPPPGSPAERRGGSRETARRPWAGRERGAGRPKPAPRGPRGGRPRLGGHVAYTRHRGLTAEAQSLVHTGSGEGRGHEVNHRTTESTACAGGARTRRRLASHRGGAETQRKKGRGFGGSGEDGFGGSVVR